MFEAFGVSTLLVAIGEIGDKTQLLALLLAARFRKPVPIILGILVATLANHGLAAGVGAAVGSYLTGPWMKWVLGLAFLALVMPLALDARWTSAAWKEWIVRCVALLDATEAAVVYWPRLKRRR